jgi:hypothetical protein
MNPRSFLKMMILLMLIPSFICLFLPDTIAPEYTEIMLPLALLIGAVLSIRVALTYKEWLRKAFLFLSLFLFLMMLTQLDPLWTIARARIGSIFPIVVLIMQWATYAILVISSFYILKVTEVRRIGTKGWMVTVAMLLLGMIIVLYNIPSVFQQIFFLQTASLYTVSLILIRILDVAIVVMLVPVVILYAQQMRVERRESITFTTIISGIILSLIGAYIYEIVFGVPLYVASHAVYHTGSLLDALYLFSYLIVAVGLYVHKMYDEWGFQMIEKALKEA